MKKFYLREDVKTAAKPLNPSSSPFPSPIPFSDFNWPWQYWVTANGKLSFNQCFAADAACFNTHGWEERVNTGIPNSELIPE